MCCFSKMNLWSFFEKPISYVNFEDVQNKSIQCSAYLLINTLPSNEQYCLIQNTIDAFLEEKAINEMMYDLHAPDKKIIIYGRNCNDESTESKGKQLIQLGLKHVFIYKGGLFEWLLLQDIYGTKSFPTTTRVLDLLKYKPDSIL